MHDDVLKTKYKVIGMMSGTSLDGLDIAYCVFRKLASGWKYTIEQAATVKYSAEWQSRLAQAHLLSGFDLMALHAAYGSYLGKAARVFADKHALKPDFVASHGHTVFHQPGKNFTTQIGNGYNLSAACSLPVICDFRMEDVAFGGEGAPLVPAGDKFLFQEFDVCLNLGGIANLSVDVKGKRLAYDICFCNMALNAIAGEVGKKYDKGGMMAATGSVNEKLLASLQKVYRKFKNKRPSLGREIFEKEILHLLQDQTISAEDRICTFTESAAREICDAIRSHKMNARVLCTGGGAFNAFLITRMLENGGDEITFIIPEDDVVKFKEALVFGFLGVLRTRGEVNVLRSVTQASRDCSSGTMIGF